MQLLARKINEKWFMYIEIQVLDYMGFKLFYLQDGWHFRQKQIFVKSNDLLNTSDQVLLSLHILMSKTQEQYTELLNLQEFTLSSIATLHFNQSYL